MNRAILLAVLLVFSLTVAAQGADSFQVVVNAANPTDEMSKDDVSRLFLKRSKTWQDREAVLPIDQTSSSSVRAAFSEAIHGRDVSRIQSYWQRKIFSGEETPPPEVGSDRDVLDFVRRNRGAIGYVSRGASLGDGVKVLTLTE